MKSVLPKRKRLRLKNYDYSQAGYYFITICVKNRENILSKIENVGSSNARPKNILTEEGKVIEKHIKEIEIMYQNIVVDEYIIMPNHIHMILIINQKEKVTISRIVQQLKGKITKKLKYSVWQKLFYEHIIRNEKEYLLVKEYIKNNPYNWKNDTYY